MKQERIAIPSSRPGGLDSAIGPHFGHCEIYTIVDVLDGRITKVETLPGIPHQQGGCLVPVKHLAENGVTALIAGGMGMRPLMGFDQAGIKVYRGVEATTAEAAVQALIRGDLERFTREFTCGAGHAH